MQLKGIMQSGLIPLLIPLISRRGTTHSDSRILYKILYERVGFYVQNEIGI